MQTLMLNSTSRWPWIMMVLRTILFATFQAAIAGVFLIQDVPAAWDTSAGWWPITASLGSLVTIALLVWLYHQEGRRYWNLLRFRRETLGTDVLTSLGILVITIPVAMLPNVLLARGLFGDQQIALDLLIRPLPMWAVALSLTIFPISIALSELPNYFGYVLPRLEAQTKRPWLAVGLTSFWLAAQHVCLPFLPDARFMIWRLVMFLPFAILLGVTLRWRSRLLPYLVIIHGLLDFSTALLVLFISKGISLGVN
jgi:hypothetical protein